jgi:hypothetical protein
MQGAVGPVLIVVDLVLAQDLPQMSLVPDEGAVQELMPASPDPAFGDRVHAWRPDVTEHGPDPGVGEDHVERGGEVRAAVADHELDLWVPKTSSTSCDQAIFVNQATDASVSSDAVLVEVGRFGQRFQRRGTVQERCGRC